MQAIKDWFACLFKPVTWLFNQLRSGILWCLGMKPKTTRS
jgi:CBS domain containing-hemolysin-like protein